MPTDFATGSQDVNIHMRLVTFSKDAPGQKYAQFSNAYASRSPYVFEIPFYARQPNFPNAVSCLSALKALMLTKASMMADRRTFDQIVTETDPDELKALGRQVTSFDPPPGNSVRDRPPEVRGRCEPPAAAAVDRRRANLQCQSS